MGNVTSENAKLQRETLAPRAGESASSAPPEKPGGCRFPRTGGRPADVSQPVEVPESAGTVRMDNMDGSKLHSVGAHLDWYELKAYGNPIAETIYADLIQMRERVRSGEAQTVELAGRVWEVQGRGIGIGTNSFGVLLKCPGLQLALACRRADKGPCASVACIGSACAGRTPEQLDRCLRELVVSVGCDVEKFKAARVDLASDLTGLPMAEVNRLLRAQMWVCQSHRINTVENGELETLTFGQRGSPVFLRVYDKRAELLKNVEKLRAYLEAHNLEELPETLVRIEFELNAEFFRERFVCESSAEVVRTLPAVAEYLFSSWCRFCSRLDRSHTERSVPCSWWTIAKDAMVKACSVAVPLARVRPVWKLPAVGRLLVSGVGCFAALCAREGVSPQSAEAFGAFIADKVKSTFASFREAIETKVIRVEEYLDGLRRFQGAMEVECT